jgi:chromosomal replication initiator protein
MRIETAHTPDRVWKDILDAIRPVIPPQSFNTWFKSTAGTSLDDKTFSVTVPNKFVSEWIQGRFKSMILSALESNLGSPRQIEFIIDSKGGNPPDNAIPSLPDKSEKKSALPDSTYRVSALNSRYLFESFVVGDSNRFARAAAIAVAEDPMKTRYNPLYIYGGVGLGKTHLAQAVGNMVTRDFSTMKVLYVTSEKFTNDFIDSIARSKTSEFARFYRGVDLLLLDDIQFLAGKEATQEQFFHTFNALYQAGKQIVLTSDRSPRDIEGLEERLLSRFQCGLVTDIQPPDLETRIAILNQKVQSENLSIPADVINYIADNVTRNIRELEGSIIKLLAYRSLTKREIDGSLAYELLKDSFAGDQVITPAATIRAVCKHYSIQPEQLKSKRKTANLVRARQIGMFLCRKYTVASLKSIGAEFGGRDHSTVIHAINTVNDGLTLDFTLKADLAAVEKLLKS